MTDFALLKSPKLISRKILSDRKIMKYPLRGSFLSLRFYVKTLFFVAEEKKVKKYLEDNYQHRTDLISPDPELKNSENSEVKKFQGVGPKTKEGNLKGKIKKIVQCPKSTQQSFYSVET